MKSSRKYLKLLGKVIGITIGVAAVFLSLKNIQGEKIKEALLSMNTYWIWPIVVGNFGVILIKASRWQMMVRSVKKVRLSRMFKILTIGYMANSILPARMGEALRAHLLGRDEELSRVTTGATLIADWIVEGLSFIVLAAILTLVTDVPSWMRSGLIITLLITVTMYTIAVTYSSRRINNRFLKKLQDGFGSLRCMKLLPIALGISLLSWVAQGLLVYMAQAAFGVHLPIWGIVLVLVAVNLAISIPSTPSHIGTFEFACVLAYTALGIDKSMGLLIGATYHILQIVPVTLVGGLMMVLDHISFRRTLQDAGPDTPY